MNNVILIIVLNLYKYKIINKNVQIHVINIIWCLIKQQKYVLLAV